MKILTGDNDLVTRKVCRDVGIDVEHLVTGPQLQGLAPEQLAETAEKATVFARLSPTQKEQIIQALQGKGHVVGFLGDGINDAPALKKADVGISVDTAVDVAKESADIVLLEKSLLVLDDGIIEGRKVFGNIIKYIRMGASSNFGNMFSVVGGSFFLPFLPMLPIQVLTNNLLYDVSQIGIPSDRVDPEFTTVPRKWNIGNIRRFMIFIGPMSSIFDYATFFLMLFFFGCIAFTAAGHQPGHEGLLRGALPHGLVRGVDPHADAHRARHPDAEDPLLPEQGQPRHALLHRCWSWPSRWRFPTRRSPHFLGFVPLPAVYWAWIAGFLVAYCVLTHIVKSWFFRRVRSRIDDEKPPGRAPGREAHRASRDRQGEEPPVPRPP